MVRDYVAWHEEYARPGSPLWERLEVAIDLLGQALDGSPPGPIRFVSLCAGQGRDVLSAASAHPRGADLEGRLVELDPVNAGTRQPREPGVLTAMQGWFEVAGFERHARVVDDEQGFGVGLHRLTGEPAPYERDRPLFTFVR